jgi:methylase of polypeptide subunit release factors
MSPDTRHEPELALFGGDETGFEMYERLFEQLQTYSAQCTVHTEESKFTLIIEFGFDQREIAKKVIQSYGWKYEFFADFAGIERFAEIHLQ